MGLTKSAEIANANGCWNRAKDGEPVFVLLGRDACAAETVLDWCVRRIKARKNAVGDEQITEALAWVRKVLEDYADANGDERPTASIEDLRTTVTNRVSS